MKCNLIYRIYLLFLWAVKLDTLGWLLVGPEVSLKLPVPALVQDGLNPSIYVLLSVQLKFFLKL